MRKSCLFVALLTAFLLGLFILPVLSLPYDVNPPKTMFCCDVNYDGEVDLKDVFATAKAYGTIKGDSNWNPRCDVNKDNKVDLTDYYAVCQDFGKHV